MIHTTDITGFFTNDWRRKLIALSLAVLSYFYVNTQIQVELDDKDVLLDLIAGPGVTSTVQTFPVPIKVKLRGPKSLLNDRNEMSMENLRGKLEVTLADQGRDGVFRVKVSPRCFREYQGVKVVKINQGEVLTLESFQRETSKLVKVKPQIDQDRLLSTFAMGEIRVIPSEIRITGPESIVREYAEIHTQKIILSDDQITSFSQTVPLDVSGIGDIRVEPKEVTVECEIIRAKATRVFRDLPVLIAETAGGTKGTVFLNDQITCQVTVSGPPALVDQLTNADINLYVNADGSGERKIGTVYNQPIECNIKRPGVKVDEIVPGEAQLKVVQKTVVKP